MVLLAKTGGIEDGEDSPIKGLGRKKTALNELVKGSDRRGFVAVYSGRNKDYSEIRIARFLQS